MSQRITLSLLFMLLSQLVSAQTDKQVWQFSGSLNFQAHTLPFHDIKGHFQNAGIALGALRTLGEKQAFGLRLQAGLFSNRMMGNSFELDASFRYRPRLGSWLRVGAGIGMGWKRMGHPVQTYQFQDGEWQKVRNAKSQLIIPVDFQLALNRQTAFNPFIAYRWVPALFYNAVLPVNMYSQFQAGVTFKIQQS